ncbi:hypothetical protein BDV24DRAFT_141454 [Aspergillus arachidicola]|uniref:Uncharacterized protein n=1 Tax=Aspergillus arachidicola TaxID=656916 RepID=A0A5N6XTY8_9EURO|nr:hypothetical protein BDV24DRAFT_141454 [Aspergillus arachidicola]
MFKNRDRVPQTRRWKKRDMHRYVFGAWKMSFTPHTIYPCLPSIWFCWKGNYMVCQRKTAPI